MKSALVVGGAGFIGSHLCERLLNDGYKVFCLDNLITGSKKNIENLVSGNFKFTELSAWETGNIEYACDHKPVDEIYYLASIASPVKYIEFPFETIDANVGGLRNALEVAHKNGSKILYTSTSEIYGDPEEMPQTEEYNGNVDPKTDRAVYDESKRLGETLCFLFKRLYNTNIKVVRIFNTYGPKMSKDDGRVIPAFLQAGLKEEKPTIYGNGEQTRSFCYIDDMIEGLVLMMDNAENGPINLGNPDEFYSINDLWEITSEIMDVEISPEHKDHITQNDPVDRCPNIRYAKKILGWQPKTDIYNGLKKTMEYFNDNPGMESNS